MYCSCAAHIELMMPWMKLLLPFQLHLIQLEPSTWYLCFSHLLEAYDVLPTSLWYMIEMPPLLCFSKSYFEFSILSMINLNCHLVTNWNHLFVGLEYLLDTTNWWEYLICIGLVEILGSTQRCKEIKKVKQVVIFRFRSPQRMFTYW